MNIIRYALLLAALALNASTTTAAVIAAGNLTAATAATSFRQELKLLHAAYAVPDDAGGASYAPQLYAALEDHAANAPEAFAVTDMNGMNGLNGLSLSRAGIANTYVPAAFGNVDPYVANMLTNDPGVPEPERWIMLLIGVGLLGMMSRHHPKALWSDENRLS